MRNWKPLRVVIEENKDSAAKTSIQPTNPIQPEAVQPEKTEKKIIPDTSKQKELIETVPVNIPVKVDIYFGLDSDIPLSYNSLSEFITFMKSKPDVKVELGGHTDNIGNPLYNKQLSQRRAEAVRRYMVKQGKNEIRITTVGYGSSKPVDTTNTKLGNRKNRRTEFTIIEK